MFGIFYSIRLNEKIVPSDYRSVYVFITGIRSTNGGRHA